MWGDFGCYCPEHPSHLLSVVRPFKAEEEREEAGEDGLERFEEGSSCACFLLFTGFLLLIGGVTFSPPGFYQHEQTSQICNII